MNIWSGKEKKRKNVSSIQGFEVKGAEIHCFFHLICFTVLQ